MNIEKTIQVLRHCTYDPKAERIYDIMRGGFLWFDEVPPREEHENHRTGIRCVVELLAYRASLSLKEPNPQWEQSWQSVKSALPEWPGFRTDRIYGQVQRDLRAAILLQERCLDRLDGDLTAKSDPKP